MQGCHSRNSFTPKYLEKERLEQVPEALQGDLLFLEAEVNLQSVFS